MNRIALIDGDIFAFEIAAGAEEPIHWGDGLWTLHAWAPEALARLDSRLSELAHSIGAQRTVVILSDDNDNWRKDVLPTYKSNRSGQRKPMLLPLLKQHLRDKHNAFSWPRLEADDVLGILASQPSDDEFVIITKDKDLQTIPGLHYLSHKEELGVFEVTQQEADNWHLIQSLAGDITDGYSGCPGIGVETARKIIEEPYGWESYEHTFKSGKRKGETETRWQKTEVDSVWEAVIAQYRKAGLGEEEALTQARVARILRHSDFNYDTKEPILWTPT